MSTGITIPDEMSQDSNESSLLTLKSDGQILIKWRCPRCGADHETLTSLSSLLNEDVDLLCDHPQCGGWHCMHATISLEIVVSGGYKDTSDIPLEEPKS